MGAQRTKPAVHLALFFTTLPYTSCTSCIYCNLSCSTSPPLQREITRKQPRAAWPAPILVAWITFGRLTDNPLDFLVFLEDIFVHFLLHLEVLDVFRGRQAFPVQSRRLADDDDDHDDGGGDDDGDCGDGGGLMMMVVVVVTMMVAVVMGVV